MENALKKFEKNSQGLRKSQPRKHNKTIRKEAIQGLEESYDPVPHSVGSPVEGSWQIPEFVVRDPLDYTSFCRWVYFVAELSGEPLEVLAEAFGIREQDLQDALKLWKQRLRQKGTVCRGCPLAIDPRFGKYCSKRCAERNHGNTHAVSLDHIDKHRTPKAGPGPKIPRSPDRA